jgi:outer membrane protein assembly factor BamB
VLALDPDDGARLWTFTAGASVLATPAILGGRVFVGCYDGTIYALDAATGARLWTHDTGAPVTSTPVRFGEVVLARSRSYDLLGLDAASGAVRWNRYVWFSPIESTPSVRDAVAHVGSSDAAKIMAVEVATGRAVWDSDVLGASWGMPAVTDRTVFVGVRGQANTAHAPGALALDRATGRIIWRFPVTSAAGATPSGFAGSPAITGERAVFGSVDGRVYAFARSAR